MRFKIFQYIYLKLTTYMKTIARTILIVAALTLALPQPSRAQMSAGNEPQRPSADAWEFMKYGEIHPSLYTGTLSLSIPFYTYKDPDFELPISFDYATTSWLSQDPMTEKYPFLSPYSYCAGDLVNLIDPIQVKG